MLALQNMSNGEVAYLLDKGGVVESEVLVALLLLETDDEEEDFLFLLFCTAFSTTSLGGNTIPVATTMLVSVLAVAAFFCLFFGSPLQVKEQLSLCVTYHADHIIYEKRKLRQAHLLASIAAMSARLPFLQVY